MSNPNRLISVLQLFDNGSPVLTVDSIAQSLNTSTSTAYRSVRSLVQAGFLDPVTGAGYALGPAFIRYDRVLRQHDPLIKTANPVMAELLGKTDQSATVILCRRFRGCVMCVHEVHGSKPHPPTSYERGVAMPMFLGATSKILLAHLPDRLLKTVYLENEQTIRRVTKVETWTDFRRQLKAIRQDGYASTDSEIANDRSAVAAPIIRDDQVVASISLVIANKYLGRRSIEDLAPAVLWAANKICKRLSNHEPLLTRG
jgi:DNA-binding IclR family transcriptional regulator